MFDKVNIFFCMLSVLYTPPELDSVLHCFVRSHSRRFFSNFLCVFISSSNLIVPV